MSIGIDPPLGFERCPVCHGTEFRFASVLWPELVSAWELAPHEAAYIDRQQGLACTGCGNNLRSMALAAAMLRHLDLDCSLREAADRRSLRSLRLLEVNRAGGLTATLSAFPGHRLIEYPEYDLCDLKLDSGSVDLVVHSDTLEHVPEPERALAECRRVLAAGGACIFTVPVVWQRLSRSRSGLAGSFHGDRSMPTPDQRVHTEFGADAWAFVLRSGFGTCTVHRLEFPAGLALEARD